MLPTRWDQSNVTSKSVRFQDILPKNFSKINNIYSHTVDLYWTRITMTDYVSYAVELHCSLPWMRERMMIYTRAKEPTNETLEAVQSYLKTVLLSFSNFTIQKKPKDCDTDQVTEMQRWHVPKYMSQDFHPHYIKPLVMNENI